MGKQRRLAKLAKLARYSAKPRKLDLNTMLSRDDVKAVTTMALQETLIHDQLSYVDPSSDRARLLKGQLNLLNQLNKTYIGAVEPHMIEYSDRFLCKTQIALDGFFDDMTDHDKSEMERIKAEWKVGVGVDPMTGQGDQQ